MIPENQNRMVGFGFERGGGFTPPKASDTKKQEYNPEAVGASEKDLSDIKQTMESNRDENGVFVGVGAGLTSGVVLTLILTPLLLNPIVLPIAIFGALLLGTVAAGVYFLATAEKTNRVTEALFEMIKKNDAGHILDTSELKGAIQVLKENNDTDSIQRIFSKMSPKQIHSMLVDNDAKNYEKDLEQNLNFKAITSGKPDWKLIDKDPYYRSIYEEWMAKKKEQIDEDTFAKDYPHIVAKMSVKKDVTNNSLESRKVTISDGLYWSRDVEWSILSEYSKSEKIANLEEGKPFKVSSWQGINKVFDILERRATISTPEELEAVMQVAEEWEFNELIQDIDLMVQNRKDLVGNEQELANFVEAHPLIQRLRNAGIDLT